MWKVRAEIVGDFVTVWNFETEIEARIKEVKLIEQGIWDAIDVWEVEK